MPRAQAHGPSSALSPGTAHAPGSPWQPSLKSTFLLGKACQNLTACAISEGQLEYKRKVQTGTAAADPDARGHHSTSCRPVQGFSFTGTVKKGFFFPPHEYFLDHYSRYKGDKSGSSQSKQHHSCSTLTNIS